MDDMPVFQPGRITQAREARGLSLAALAGLINREPGVVSHWETGASKPNARCMAALARALRVPVVFLLRPMAQPGHASARFCSDGRLTRVLRASVQRRIEWLHEIVARLQDWVDFPAVSVPRLGRGDWRRIDDGDIEEMADECRRIWRLGSGPVGDLSLVLENAGAVCARECLGEARLRCVASWCGRGERPCILVNTANGTGMQERVDAAHALGHLVLHWSVGGVDSVAALELARQARHFARAFLLPARAFAGEAALTVDGLAALERRWGVPVATMLARCRDLRFMDEPCFARLCQQYLARRWQRGEPFDGLAEPGRARLLPRAVRLVVAGARMTRAELLEQLALDSADVASLCALPSDFFALPEAPAGEPSDRARIIPFPGT